MQMPSRTNAQTATHFIRTLRHEKADVAAGAGVGGLGWRWPNKALNRIARNAGSLRGCRLARARLARRWAPRAY